MIKRQHIRIHGIVILCAVYLLMSCEGSGGGSGGSVPLTATWVWVSGADVCCQNGVYGIQGIADPSNVPGARNASISWMDSQGRLWLFGGHGYDSAGNLDDLNDLWRFDGSTWTWVSGADVCCQNGVYGIQGIADLANVPGARAGTVSWMDSQGFLWLFGGYGFDSAGNIDDLSDIWKLIP